MVIMFSISSKVVSAMEGKRASQRSAGEGVASLNGVIRVGLIEKVTFEQRLKGREGISPAVIWRQSLLDSSLRKSQS